jgi:hypothetical protein
MQEQLTRFCDSTCTNANFANFSSLSNLVRITRLFIKYKICVLYIKRPSLFVFSKLAKLALTFEIQYSGSGLKWSLTIPSLDN